MNGSRNIVFSRHAKDRLQIRGIPAELAADVVENADERYLDTATGHLVALKRAALYDKVRDVMVVYRAEMEAVTVLTIHPLKEGQRDKRLKSGRWREIQ